MNLIDKDIDILIGANFYWDFTHGRCIRIDSGLVAVDTILGWVLSGSFNPTTTENISINHNSAHVLKVECTNESPYVTLNHHIKQFWEIESAGKENDGDEFDVDSFLERIKFKKGRYSVPLPWKESHDILPDNYANSRNRLAKLNQRLIKNRKLFAEYDDIIKQQELDGIIERLPPDSVSIKAGEVHYLPHHVVIRPEKTTSKLRVVFDASSNSPSLNDCLEKGVCLIPLIFDILIRFRAHKVAITSDIKQAYLNIEVDEAERNFLRFLWMEDINRDIPKSDKPHHIHNSKNE